MNVIYSAKSDTLILVNPTNKDVVQVLPYKNNVSVSFDIDGVPVLIEILDASITFGIPTKELKKFSEVK